MCSGLEARGNSSVAMLTARQQKNPVENTHTMRLLYIQARCRPSQLTTSFTTHTNKILVLLRDLLRLFLCNKRWEDVIVFVCTHSNRTTRSLLHASGGGLHQAALKILRSRSSCLHILTKRSNIIDRQIAVFLVLDTWSCHVIVCSLKLRIQLVALRLMQVCICNPMEGLLNMIEEQRARQHMAASQAPDLRDLRWLRSRRGS